MTDEVYSKAVVDQFLAGLFEVLGSTTRLVVETRINDGLASRSSTIEMFSELAGQTQNLAARGFYQAMADRTATADAPESPRQFTVIDGGLADVPREP